MRPEQAEVESPFRLAAEPRRLAARAPQRKTRLPLQARVERAGSKRFHASEVDDINQLRRSVTVKRGRSKRRQLPGERSLLPAEIDLHHDRFLAEVITPFDYLPAKFAVEPFG